MFDHWKIDPRGWQGREDVDYIDPGSKYSTASCNWGMMLTQALWQADSVVGLHLVYTKGAIHPKVVRDC